MSAELLIISQPYQNFADDLNRRKKLMGGIAEINRELQEKYNAHIDLTRNQWFVVFERESDLTYFLLKWS